MTDLASPRSVTTTGAVTDTWDQGVVVFLIGMRINAWWRPDLWIPIMRSMTRMLGELREHPEYGLLGVAPTGLSNPIVIVQYWRSVEALHRYAQSNDGTHRTAWADFHRRVRATHAVGIWHETYVVPAGAHESIYINMPLFGLAAATGAQPASGPRATAAGRLGQADR